MKKYKGTVNAFFALIFIICAVIVLSLGCASIERPMSVGAKICQVGCKSVGGELYMHIDHRCYCVFEMAHIGLSSKQDKPSIKQDLPANPDKPSIGGTMVQR